MTMDANKKNREHISALGDGELPRPELELAFATLATGDGHAAWLEYQRIGDELRAAPVAALSPGFNAALAARLEAEPAYGRAPQPAEPPEAQPVSALGRFSQ
jgi:negative regulator of sigma E activity